jgi:hypothetical protein
MCLFKGVFILATIAVTDSSANAPNLPALHHQNHAYSKWDHGSNSLVVPLTNQATMSYFVDLTSFLSPLAYYDGL